MFWGITIENGKRYTQTVDVPFHVSMAALEKSDRVKNTAVSIMVEHEKTDFLLCTLQHGSCYQQTLDLNFVDGEEVTFFINGEGTVHLTGYLRLDMGEMDSEDLSSELDESCEEEEEKKPTLAIANKRKLPEITENNNAKKKRMTAAELMKMSDDSDETEDDDDDDEDDDDESDDDDDEEEEMLKSNSQKKPFQKTPAKPQPPAFKQNQQQRQQQQQKTPAKQQQQQQKTPAKPQQKTPVNNFNKPNATSPNAQTPGSMSKKQAKKMKKMEKRQAREAGGDTPATESIVTKGAKALNGAEDDDEEVPTLVMTPDNLSASAKKRRKNKNKKKQAQLNSQTPNSLAGTPATNKV